MRKIFLDCGTNLCQGLEEISKNIGVNDEWIIYSFDVNPEIFNSIVIEKYPNVKFVNKGVWINDEFKELNVEVLTGNLYDHLGDNPIFNVSEEAKKKFNMGLGGGTNIIENINYRYNLNIEKYHTKVECFDFSKFILDNFSKDDFIVIKMDIEGSEFEVLDKMFKDGSIDYVNTMFVEWHDDMRSISSTQLQENIIQKGIQLSSWR
jgi:hypothetical protein